MTVPSAALQTALPTSADVVVVGGGTAGAAVAGLLAELTSDQVVLLEAGPDYGPRDSGLWPEDLLDARQMPMFTHDWGYTGEVGGRTVLFNRARVLGGCSSHNGVVVAHGARSDYDGWAAAGNPGWSTAELWPLFESAWERLKVSHVGHDELTPFQDAVMRSSAAAGFPIVDDFNDLDEKVGVAPFPTNHDDGVRHNSAFAYVDPVRDKGNLTVVGGAHVERVLIENGAAAGVVVHVDGESRELRAPRVVVSSGAYGSPAILLRSGIGPSAQLESVGVEPLHELPGVGENLHDQPTVEMDYAGTPELVDAMIEFGERRWRPDEQVIVKYASTGYGEGFDMHIYPWGGPSLTEPGSWRWMLGVACLTPLSRGSLRLTGPSVDDKPAIDHAYLSDPGGYDLQRLVEGVLRTREVVSQSPLSELLGEELFPGPAVDGEEALRRCISDSTVHYYHPAGSCKMGPADDPAAVVGADGAVHGLEGLYVADASIMPAVMSGNTNVPTTVIGEKMARGLAGAQVASPRQASAPPSTR
jgi:choline dehydrogenase